MDLLFHRYASPFVLLDELILTNDFSAFINTFMEAKEEEMQWQYYLSKIFDKSFIEFQNSLKTEHHEVSESDIETTIKDSQTILNNFSLNQK